ncbi:MAG: hypothetical protein U1F48_18000 [Burkholderiales bacterium]
MVIGPAAPSRVAAHSPSQQPRVRLAALAALLAVLPACAPDAVNNRAATGLDGYVAQVQRSCAPVQLGRYQFATPLMGGGGDGSYDYWLDQTSRLYSRAITPAQYRESLNAFFGAGNDATIGCIVGLLPPP